MIIYHVHAGMAELADAHGSGPCGSNTMRVQVPFPALYFYYKHVKFTKRRDDRQVSRLFFLALC